MARRRSNGLAKWYLRQWWQKRLRCTPVVATGLAGSASVLAHSLGRLRIRAGRRRMTPPLRRRSEPEGYANWHHRPRSEEGLDKESVTDVKSPAQVASSGIWTPTVTDRFRSST